MRPHILLAPLLVVLPACKWAAAKAVGAISEVIRGADGQTTGEGMVSADGRLQTGPWRFYYRDGRLRSEGSYADDVQVGPWKYYFENGNLEWEGNYDRSGIRTGLWRFYHDNGAPRAEGMYADDREVGLWRYWDRNGKPAEEGEFDRGVIAGLWTRWYANGGKREQGLHARGLRVGPWRFWNDKGEPSSAVVAPPAGMELVEESWPNGEPRRLGVARAGETTGSWVAFHENGQVRARLTRHDRDEASWSIADEEGRLLACGRIAGKDFVDWRVATQTGMRDEGRQPMPQLPPASTADWSPATLAQQRPIAEVAAVWLAELSSPVRQPASPSPTPQPAAAATIAPTPEQMAPVEATARIAAPAQPSFTVREIEELPALIEEYKGGKVEKRASADRYGVAKSRQGKPRRRDDLEGAPFPLTSVSVADGSTLSVMELRGKKGFVVVVMRGLKGSVCVYCVAQTRALADCKAEFDALGVDVLVVYPGAKENVQPFLEACAMESELLRKQEATIPYRLVYDADLQLVTALGIEGDLALPTTLYVDAQGIIRYAYTGQNRADRPPATQVLDFIKKQRQ